MAEWFNAERGVVPVGSNPTVERRHNFKGAIMPLKQGASPATISANIKEFHKGPTYAKTAAKYGTSDANKQAVAVALSVARKGDKVARVKAGGGRTAH